MTHVRKSIIALVTSMLCIPLMVSAGAPPIFDSVDKPAWWGESGEELTPFESRDDVKNQYSQEGGVDRVYVKRALLTANLTPENEYLVSFALFYAPFNESLANDISIQISEYFVRYYFYRDEEGYCFRCSGKASMVASVVERLVRGYCRAGRLDSAVDLTKRFIAERQSELDVSSQSGIYATLTHCRGRSLELNDKVYSVLEKAYEELWPLANSSNSYNDVYRLGRSVVQAKTARGIEDHCALKRLEAAHYKRAENIAYSRSWMLKMLDSGDWAAHLFGFKNLVLFESEDTLKLAKEIFLNDFYGDKFPNWKSNYAYNEAIFGMACLNNRDYESIIVSHFYNNELLFKSEQIKLVLETIYPAVNGYERRVDIKDIGAEVEVGIGHYRGLLDAHGQTFIFKKIKIKGKVYWVPVNSTGRWIA